MPSIGRMPFLLSEALSGSVQPIDIVDVGAMHIAGAPLFYERLIASGLPRVVGFEPIEEECRKLNAAASKHHSYLPHFLGDGQERTFYLTNTGYTSSLYEPNMPLVSRFNRLPDVMKVVQTSRVRTTRLDDIAEVRSIDYLKLDVQGAELDVLRGADRLLAGVLAAEVEVEFVQLYKDQPLFAEVDQHMRSRGFVLHTFTGICGRAFRPLIINNDATAMLQQVLWTDAVYVRDFERLQELSADQLLKLAVIVHDVYESFDLAALLLHNHDAKSGKDLWAWYMQRLTGAPPGERPPL